MTSFNLNYTLRMLSPNIVTVGVTASTYGFGGGYKSLHWSTEPQGPTGPASVYEHPQFCHTRGREMPKKSESRVCSQTKVCKIGDSPCINRSMSQFPFAEKKIGKKIKNQPFQSTGKHPKASKSLRSICSWKNTSALWKHTHTQSELLGFMPRGFLYPPSSRSKILPARGGELSFGSVVKWTKI